MSSRSAGAGDSTSSVTLSLAGTYSLVVTDSLGCTATDTMELQNYPTITFELGPDIEHCGEDGVWLHSPIHADTMLWSNGTTADSTWADSTETYTLSIRNACGPVTDAVHVNLIREPKLQAPNVFSPNGDGINDVLLFTGPVWQGFDLHIYERWGDLFFRSDDIQNSWDGFVRGQGCSRRGVFHRIEGAGL